LYSFPHYKQTNQILSEQKLGSILVVMFQTLEHSFASIAVWVHIY